MGVLLILRVAEVAVTLAGAVLVAVGNWDSLAFAVPGAIGLLVASHHYKREARLARGRRGDRYS